MLVSQFGAQPNEALVAGLRSPDEYYQVSRIHTRGLPVV